MIFGRAVAINGEVVVIGTSGDIDKGSCSGAAYIFRLSADSLNREPPWGDPQKSYHLQ